MRFLEHLIEGIAKPTSRNRGHEELAKLLMRETIKSIHGEADRRGKEDSLEEVLDEVDSNNTWRDEISYMLDDLDLDGIASEVKEYFGR